MRRVTRTDTMSKYRNIQTLVFGEVLDSRREASRYLQLRAMQDAGEVKNLRRQVDYPIVVNGVKICKYVADFVYEQNGRQVVEDSKGYRTREYRLKKKLMKAVYGIEIVES